MTTYNYFGGNLGGPIISATRRSSSATICGSRDRRGDGYIITVPGADFRNGDFSSQDDSVYDPNTGDRDHRRRTHAVRGQQHSLPQISPIAAKLLSYRPAAEHQ